MNILWHSVKYPPKKDGDYYFCRIHTRTVTEGPFVTTKYRCIDTLHYTVKYGFNTYTHNHDSAFELRDDDQWAEVEDVED